MQTATETKKTSTRKTNTKKPNSTNPTVCPAVAEVKLVPLDLIDTAEQVRTEFDEDGIEELAADIAMRGLLQPILLNPVGDRYLVIAGERRLRAVRQINHAAIPALITKASAEDATLMQLAENIQREDLSLNDQAKAVRKLYDQLGNLQSVAETVKKSKSWCSKRMAMSCENFSWRAKNLLEEGHTEDMEILNGINSLDNIDSCRAYEMARNIIEGKAGRKEVLEALRLAKEDAAAEKTNAKTKAAKKVSHAKPTEPPPPPLWAIEEALDDIDAALNCADEMPAIEIYNSWKDEERKIFNLRLSERYGDGNRVRLNGEPISKMNIRNFVFNSFCEHGIYSIEAMAMIEGYAGKDMKVQDLLVMLQEKDEE